MLQSDPLETLRRLYDQWAVLKATVEAWLQGWWHAWGWLVELGVVAYFALALVVLALGWGLIGVLHLSDRWRAAHPLRQPADATPPWAWWLWGAVLLGSLAVFLFLVRQP